MTLRLWKWLCQEGPSAGKHQGWLHPVATGVLHYLVATIVTFGVHDSLVDNTAETCAAVTDNSSLLERGVVARGVAAYAIWLLLWRLYHCNNDHRSGIVYEFTWLCNVTLVLGACALLVGRPIVATAHCVAVGIDQLMWYVDLTGWTLR